MRPLDSKHCTLLDGYNEGIGHLNAIFDYLYKDQERWELPLHALSHVIGKERSEMCRAIINNCPEDCMWCRDGACDYDNFMSSLNEPENEPSESKKEGDT